jgi:hypothetical protein
LLVGVDGKCAMLCNRFANTNLIEFEEVEFVDATEAPDDFPVVWASCWEEEEYEPQHSISN